MTQSVHTTSSYPVSEWDNYAELFASVTTSMQVAVYKEACLHLSGAIVDCGCGSAKIAPFLAANKSVFSYTGIDLSETMVQIAQGILQKVNHPRFTVQQSSIESVHVEGFTSGVSVQSYYSWTKPERVLQAIHSMLVPQAVFVLATPNKQLPVDTLAREAEQELLAHPNFGAYRAYNLQLVTSPNAHFIDIDDLIGQVRQVGFQVQEAHQRHFRGGLNFLVLTKGI